MTLTAKQVAQIKKAPPKQAASLTATYRRQNAQTQAKAKAKAQVRPKAKTMPPPEPLGSAFDAFSKYHLPVDEVTAPYITSNFMNTMMVQSHPTMDKIVVVAPRQATNQETYRGPLTDIVAVEYNANDGFWGNMPALGFQRCPIIDRPPRTTTRQPTAVRARLHNMSARVECLGTTNGLYPPGSVYMGTVPTLETGPGSGFYYPNDGTTLKMAWADDNIQVGYLQSFSASALLNKAAQVDSAIAENVSYKEWRDLCVVEAPEDSDGNHTAFVGSLPISTSLEPIVIYIPAAGAGSSSSAGSDPATTVQYRITVATQWCSRHPHNVILRSTAKHHQPTPTSKWHKAIKQVKDVGAVLAHHAGRGAVHAAQRAAAQWWHGGDVEEAAGMLPLLVD